MITTTLFALFAAMTVLGAALAVLVRGRPAFSALAVVTAMVALAGVFVLLDAHFLAVAQVLIAAGAVGAAALFGVVLLDREPAAATPSGQRLTKALAAGVAVVALAGLLPFLPEFAVTADPDAAAALPEDFGGVASVGGILFTRFVLPLTAGSLALLAGVIGAVTLVRARSDQP